VRRGTGLPRFPGWNFRASEIQAAVARVQLTRLDGLLERMRANHAYLSERISGLPGLTLRRANDDGGDAGICLIAFAENAHLAADAVAALRLEGVEAMRLYDPAVPDLHVYPYWRPIFEALAEAGRPAPECPDTLAVLERSIHIDVSPLCAEHDLDEFAFAFEKVARVILT
jgi:dTDP-4-amino-4,6-dideoxygalactose transaminase